MIYILIVFSSLSSSTIIGHWANYPIQHSLPSIFLSPSIPATHSVLHFFSRTFLPQPSPHRVHTSLSILPRYFLFLAPDFVFASQTFPQLGFPRAALTGQTLSVLPMKNDLIRFFIYFCFFQQFDKFKAPDLVFLSKDSVPSGFDPSFFIFLR